MQSERPRVLSYIQRPVSTIATPLHWGQVVFWPNGGAGDAGGDGGSGGYHLPCVYISVVLRTGFQAGHVLLENSNLRPQVLSFVSCVILGKSFNFLLSDYTSTKRGWWQYIPYISPNWCED